MKLNIPEQTEPGNDEFPSHPKKVKKWLAELKQANMGEFARQVYNGLMALNRQAMPAKYRMENMELLREPTRNIFNQLHKHFVNRSIPLPEKSQKIIHLNQSLLSEMAAGYKIIIFEAANNLSKIDSKTLLIASERVLHYYSELLLRSCQIYTGLPQGSWWDIHRVYAFAEAKGLHQKSVKDPELPVKAITVEDYYKQIMLFSLARPNSLRQSDAERLFRLLNSWAKMTRLDAKPAKNRFNRYYISRLDGDAAPNCVSDEDLSQISHVRALDTHKLVEFLQKQETDLEEFSSAITKDDSVSLETLRTLIASWGLCAKRRFSRAERDEDLQVAIGLKAIFTALMKEVAPETPAKKKIVTKPRTSFALAGIPDNQRSQVDVFDNPKSNFLISQPDLKKGSDSSSAWDMVARGRTMTDTYAQELRDKHEEMGEMIKQQPDLYWKVTNVSAGGYCLRWASLHPSRALVGEMIGIREKEPDQTYQWRIGVIRWMQFSREHGLEIGVQVLSPKVIPCKVRRAERKNEEPFECLMLPGIKPIQQPSTLLLPAHAFRKGNRLSMHVNERDMEVTLGTVREHTGSFTQFQFTQPGDGDTFDDPDETSNDEASSDPDNFDSIWSSL